jgi:hypothetical protein
LSSSADVAQSHIARINEKRKADMQQIKFEDSRPAKLQRSNAGAAFQQSASSSSSSQSGKDAKEDPQPAAKQEKVKTEPRFVIELD